MKKIINTSIVVCLLIILSDSPKLDAQDKSAGGQNNSTQSKYTLNNCVNTFSKDKIEKTDAGYQYWFVDKDFADGKTLKLSVVSPHKATHAPHVHPEDEFFFVLEGKAEVYLNGQWKAIGPNTSFYCPSNVEHGIRNAGNKELKYLVIKKYEKK